MEQRPSRESPLSTDEERVILALAWAERSLTFAELSARIETADEALLDAVLSLYRRHFLLTSRGIGEIDDTYLLSRSARIYARRHLLPEMPREMPIEVLTPQDKRR